jgi:hypothetical protein
MQDTSRLEPPSPEFVLEVLRDTHRHQCAYDPEADSDVLLSFETTVAEWRDAWDLVSTAALGAALNEVWGISVPTDAWRACLEPYRARTLRNVCDLIASHTRRTVIHTAGFLGASSVAAGAFLTVRALLLRAGAEAAEIRPSLPIASLARRYPHIFLGPISALAPGRLPTVIIRTPLYTAAVAALCVTFVASLALAKPYPALAFVAALLCGLVWAATWFLARRVAPAEVRFGPIQTFRDLAEVIAGQNPA